MPAITGTTLCEDAFALLGVFLPGEAMPGPDGAYALRMLNDLLSEWSQRPPHIPVIARERFPLVANQGGPTTGISIGPGGTFNTAKPANQNSVVSASLVYTATPPTLEVRYPLTILTDDAYSALAVPAMTGTQPTCLYYNPTYALDRGSIHLWPVPDNALNALELFLQKSVPQFADLSTTYYLPDGLPRALKYNLADGLQVPYGKDLSEKAQRIVVSSLATFKRSNSGKLTDVPNDWFRGRGHYNIATDNR